MLNTLISAIKQRQYIVFTYSGLEREAMPVAVGESRAGNMVLRCYQTEGGHVSAGHEWDLCEISKISGLQVLSKTFLSNPPGYKKGDKHMLKIHAEL
jgi:hypothetical protein